MTSNCDVTKNAQQIQMNPDGFVELFQEKYVFIKINKNNV